MTLQWTLKNILNKIKTNQKNYEDQYISEKWFLEPLRI